MRPSAPGRGLSLRLSVTDRCQLRCVYCRPAGDAVRRRREELLSFEEITRFVRGLRAGFGLSTVRLTGGEPLLRRELGKLVAMLAGLGLPDLALTTNGQLLAAAAAELKAAGLRRVNVSLDTLDARVYRRLTRGGELAAALAGIEAALRCGLRPVRLNAVMLRGWNDAEAPELARFALEAGCQMRFLELMPLGCAREGFERRFVPSAETRARLEAALALEPLPSAPGRSSRDFRASDRSGRRGVVGLISPRSAPFCAGCARLRLTSTGQLVSCLARGDATDVRALLRSGRPDAEALLAAAAREALAGKRPRPVFRTARPMAAVGG